MQAEFGEIIGLVAPNGTGKTTFFNAISGLIPRKNGNISLNKIDYNSRSATYLKELFFLESSKDKRLQFTFYLYHLCFYAIPAPFGISFGASTI